MQVFLFFSFFFCQWDLICKRRPWKVEIRIVMTFIQMTLVTSMQCIFVDDWNNVQCSSRFSAMAKFFLPCKKSTFIRLRFMLI